MNLEAGQLAAITAGQALDLPAPVLDGLASRFRSSGLFLMALRGDGSVSWHDAAAGMFFLRYFLPLQELARHDPAGGIRSALTRAGSGISFHRHLPGVVVAAVPHLEKRRTVATLIVAARDESFQLDEDVLRTCSQLRLDSIWLGQQAHELPAYNEASLTRQARLVAACLRDQLRLIGLEQELTGVSEQLASNYEELSLIYQVSGGMKVNRSAAEFFRQTCQELLMVMGMHGAGAALSCHSEHCGAPVLCGDSSLAGETLDRLTTELIAEFENRKSPILINDFTNDRQFSWLLPHCRQLLAVPVQRYEKTLGCLFALDKDSGDFDSADARLLTSIANQSAIYLENATLFDDVRGLMMGLMHSLTSAVDAKDPYTCGHSERVALLSRHLSQQIRLDDGQVEQIYMAGLLHDVGKIGVPEAVLQKTGKLTTEEFALMKKHPEIGARILHDVPQIKRMIPGVLCHHERFDGTGYPAGMSGHDIPLMGRIICLADSFDAMTSNRTYRSALPLATALAEIRRCAGTHFDPDLVDAFLQTPPDDFRELLQDHQIKSKRLLDLHDDSHIGSI